MNDVETPDLADRLAVAADRFQHGEPVGDADHDGPSDDGAALRALLPTVRGLLALGRVTPDAQKALAAPAPGRRLGACVLIRELGRGGMGVVFEAEQVALGRRVAVKVLSGAAALDPRRRQRFERESRAAAGLRHPHIVPVFAVGDEDDTLYYAMQLIDGWTLADVIAHARSARDGTRPPAAETRTNNATGTEPADAPPAAPPTPPIVPPPGTSDFDRFAARLAAEVADALDHAHQFGVVHRDVKPRNLMIDRRGWVWVTDFGLAATTNADGLTGTGDLVGTARYMSPEQLAGKRGLVDQRADVYALGLTLYELLALEPAFGGEPSDFLRRIAGAAPPSLRRFDPRVPRDLMTIVTRATEPDPADRYQTAAEVAADLNRFLAGEPIRARPPGWGERVGRWAGRHRGRLVAATAAAVLLSITAGVAWGVTRAALADERAARAAERERVREGHAVVQSTLLRVSGDREVRDPAFEALRADFRAKGVRYLERFLRDHGADPAFEPEAACAAAQLADLLRAEGRTAEAVGHYRDAAIRYDRLVARSPEPQRSAFAAHAALVATALAECESGPGREP